MTAGADSKAVKCSKCHALLPPELYNLAELAPCPSCGSNVQVEIFPALFVVQKTTVTEKLLVEGESSCFYHAANKASIVCESCGRFVCELCHLELNGRHVCPACLETGQKKGKFTDLQNSRVLYDRMALQLALLSLFIFWFGLIAAPVALYVVIRYRNEPCSITGKSKADFIIAGILAFLIFSGWVVSLVVVLNGNHR